MACCTVIISYGQKNYFWTEGGIKYPQYSTNLFFANNHFEAVPSSFQIPSNKALFLSYGYGMMFNEHMAFETGASYNPYKFKVQFYSTTSIISHPDFFAIELPFRFLYSSPVKYGFKFQIGIGQTFNFINRDVPNTLTESHAFLSAENDIYYIVLPSLEKAFFTLTQFTGGISKEFYRRFEISVLFRWNLGYQPILYNYITYEVYNKGENAPETSLEFGSIKASTKGTYYNINLSTRYKF